MSPWWPLRRDDACGCVQMTRNGARCKRLCGATRSDLAVYAAQARALRWHVVSSCSADWEQFGLGALYGVSSLGLPAERAVVYEHWRLSACAEVLKC